MEKVDLHVHSTASDGTLTPSGLVKEAQKAGLSAFALTDHDTVDGIAECIRAGKESEIEVIPGIEISTRYKDKEIHIVGLCIDYTDEQFLNSIGNELERRNARNEKLIERFNEYEKRLQELSMPSYAIEDPIKRAERWIEEYKEKVKLEHTIKEITTHALTIEDSRLVINRLVRKMATEVYHGKFQNCWDALYNKFNYLEGINIKKRKRAKGQSMLDTLNEEETYNLEVVVKNWCVEHNIDIEEQLKLK